MPGSSAAAAPGDDVIDGLVRDALRPYLDLPLDALVARVRASAGAGAGAGDRDGSTGAGASAVVFGAPPPDGVSIVLFGPFGGELRWKTPMPMIRGYLLYRLLAPMTSPTPAVVVLPGPSARFGALHAPEALAAVRSGDFAPIAGAYCGSIEGLGLRRVCVQGFSQGASLATFVTAAAPVHGIEVDSLALGDPPGLRQQRWPGLVGRYLREASGTTRDLAHNPLHSYQLAYRQRANMERGRLLVKQAGLCLALARGHGRGRLAEVLRQVLSMGVPTSIAVGELSRLSPVSDVAHFVSTLSPECRARCDVAVVAGRHHGWLHDTPMFLRSVLLHLVHKSRLALARPASAPDRGKWPDRLT